MNALVGKVVNGNSIQLSGTIVPQISLAGCISTSVVLEGSVVIPEIVGEVTDYYAGSYEVIPRADSPVVLETERKVMKQNVTVKEISTFNVSNTSGGSTFYIATVGETQML